MFWRNKNEDLVSRIEKLEKKVNELASLPLEWANALQQLNRLAGRISKLFALDAEKELVQNSNGPGLGIKTPQPPTQGWLPPPEISDGGSQNFSRLNLLRERK